MLGDTILVNGTLGPYVTVPQKFIRLRLLNGSNARRYNFGFSDDRPFRQISSDGGLLDGPIERTRLVLAPGERVEIVVDMSRTVGSVSLVSYAVPGAMPMLHLARRLFSLVNDEYQRFTILELHPRAGAYPAEELPAKLNSITRLEESRATKVRLFRLTDRSSINEKQMDHARIDAIVRRGDTEVWEIRNEEALFYHPFHVHDVQFQILDRDGKRPEAYELGWKDVVLVKPRETVRLIMQFSDYADPTLPYMFHCHILEHEDMGMMGQFIVVDDPA
jgi:FtsP/CotA-like multicopper oxidase with cupredoxin domain